MRKLTSVLAAIALAGSPVLAAPAAPKAAAPKAAAPKAAAPKPAAPRPAGAGFDARDPANLVALLSSMGATAQVADSHDGDVKLSVKTPSFSFGAEYVDCGASGKACQALAFSATSEKSRANLAQLNAFNQTSITCRVFQDQTAKPHVVYSTILTATDTREELRTHLGVWQGCLVSFGAFLADPIAYLASAP